MGTLIDIGKTVFTAIDWLYKTVFQVIEGISKDIDLLMKAMHYDTLVKIDKILEMTSGDYRELKSKMFNAIRDFSKAIGYPAYYLNLLLYNVRQIVIDSAALFGKKYEFADASWLVQEAAIMQHWSDFSTRFYTHPELIFTEMDFQVITDAHNNRAAYFSGLLGSVSNIISHVDKTIEDISTVAGDLENLNRDLPTKVSNVVKPLISGVLKPFDDWKKDTYDIWKNKLEHSIGVIDGIVGKHDVNIDSLVNRLKKPTGVLLELNNLPDEERFKEEDTLQDLSTRSSARDLAPVIKQTAATNFQLAKIREALEKAPKPEMILSLELEGAAKLLPGVIDRKTTWFVGDY